MNNNITIYTDGAASGNPGKAGWGVVMFFHDDKLKVKSAKLKVVELGGGSPHATNNQMELTAAIEALKYVKNTTSAQGNPVQKVEIFADSKYVITGINEWIHGWMQNGWRNAAKKPVMNRELWEALHELNQKIKPKWSYVEGHMGDKWNERADEIAVSFYNEPVKLKNAG